MQKMVGFFFIFNVLKWLKFDIKYLKNAKISDANLYIIQQGACVPVTYGYYLVHK